MTTIIDYKKTKRIRSEHIKLWDWLLLVGMVMAPMTSLRVWKVGPAEVLCLIWGLKFVNGKIRDSELLRFFGAFLALLGIGTIIGSYVSPRETDPSGLLTWVYFAVVSILFYKGLSQNKLEYNERLLMIFVRIASAVYTFLCLYGVFVGKRFLGMRLWYGGVRFTGGATNPHQIALMVTVLIILSLRDIVRHGNILFDCLCIAGCIYALTKTSSTTAIMATTVGVVFWANSVISKNKKHRKTVYVIEVLLISLALVLFYKQISRLIYDWIADDTNGLGRLSLFESYGITFKKSPIFGLGPGVHANGGGTEYHNTYIEILAATGVVGFTVFVIFTIRLISKVMVKDIYFFPVLVACYMYGMAGFGMRRLVYWIAIVFVIVICDQTIIKDKQPQLQYSDSDRSVAR